MNGYIGLTKRNLLLYFKDRQAIIFSLLTPIIVFMLYLLFLKNNYVDSIQQIVQAMHLSIQERSIDLIVYTMLLTGITGSSLITIPYSCLSTIVKDKESKVDADIATTPMKRYQIALAYYTSATISAFVMTSLLFTIGLLFMQSVGHLYLATDTILRLYGTIGIGSISATACLMVLVLFFRSTAASDAFYGLLSAGCGFVIGAYIPLSQFSKSIQTVCNLLPATHITVMMRNLLTKGFLTHIKKSILGGNLFVKEIKNVFSFQATMFDHEISMNQSLSYIGILFVLSLFAIVFVYAKTYRRK
ncbi:MAG: ABC transporter permease [Absicoccus sp.]|jgi:hypothetical protein|uniref:ABC transporter permease n=1 Tax=Absicoccus intestinalis TaxID=2926319 RepID=A0ABU4WKK6_9FIRM|nr:MULTISPECIES: ABC transporter permease [Absicoccus]MDD6459454.1 ABC transporter permease [Absicoccus porci]MDX8417081.1 ABC transporter permease [Absicoccus sp. CLA-KB-P134]MDY3035034.1 ABC transporter permease [Absicoccus sp.]